ncbi:hypothetical protein [Pontibacter cellulosilyticus]|uniref:Uncharacterized protein n=1 Tax=Pontibacter cellulosilyticus TaxID=1720253 RepID=A0A923N2M7_9BACT|nr:hypothetical protein [Pontibacter cellulosilyticus]MBC5991755.1 hypothetical protein [Pontibacter cellulosilyticus]
MKSFKLAFIVIILLVIDSCEQQKLSNVNVPEMELPHWTVSAFEKPGFKNKYNFDTKINPFYLNLDIDGNNTIDFAAVVVERVSGRRGIAILTHESDSIQIFGAGNHKTLGGSNWNWLIGWKAEERLTAGAGTPKNVGTALILITNKGSANWMYWDGKEWEWVAQ